MPITNYGGYFPLKMKPEVLSQAPKSLQTMWDKVVTAQVKITDGRDMLEILEREANQAESVDEQAAVAAVAAGKPIPPSTVVVTHEAAEQQRRTVRAYIDHAADIEETFTVALNDHRGEMEAGFLAHAEQALNEAQAALDAAADAVQRFEEMGGLWLWSRSDGASTPDTFGYGLPRVQGQDIGLLLGSCISALTNASPEVRLQQEADAEAEWRAAQGRATADGLVMDTRQARQAVSL